MSTMPELLYCAPCETVVFSTQGLLSLVNVIENITVPSSVPEDAHVPVPIHVAVGLRVEPDEAGRDIELSLRLVGPDGTIRRDKASPAIRLGAFNHKHVFSFERFPLSPPGCDTLELWMRDVDGAAGPETRAARYAINVIHEVVVEPESEPDR